jgi:oligoendopeptidase F
MSRPFNIQDTEILCKITQINQTAVILFGHSTEAINDTFLDIYSELMQGISMISAYDSIYGTAYLGQIKYLKKLMISPFLMDERMTYQGMKYEDWITDFRTKNNIELSQALFLQYENYQQFMSTESKDASHITSSIVNSIYHYKNIHQIQKLTPMGVFAKLNRVDETWLSNVLLSFYNGFKDTGYTNRPDTVSQNVSIEQAFEWIENAYKAYSLELYAIVRNFFRNRNFRVITEKNHPSFSIPIHTDFGSFVYINYNESIDSVYDLAHEIGHVVHQELCFQNPFLNSSPHFLLSETGSLFSEVILDIYFQTQNIVPLDYLKRRQQNMVKHSVETLSFTEEILSMVCKAWTMNPNQVVCDFLNKNALIKISHIDEILRHPYYSFAYIVGYSLTNFWRTKIQRTNDLCEYIHFLKDSSILSFQEILLKHKISIQVFDSVGLCGKNIK